MKKIIVHAWDENFNEKDSFDNWEDAFKHADKMAEIFGSWNVDVYSEE